MTMAQPPFMWGLMVANVANVIHILFYRLGANLNVGVDLGLHMISYYALR